MQVLSDHLHTWPNPCVLSTQKHSSLCSPLKSVTSRIGHTLLNDIAS